MLLEPIFCEINTGNYHSYSSSQNPKELKDLNSYPLEINKDKQFDYNFFMRKFVDLTSLSFIDYESEFDKKEVILYLSENNDIGKKLDKVITKIVEVVPDLVKLYLSVDEVGIDKELFLSIVASDYSNMYNQIETLLEFTDHIGLLSKIVVVSTYYVQENV